jgi:endonuclease/exonuclease/phosphatase family metal-dependent hydrolase
MTEEGLMRHTVLTAAMAAACLAGAPAGAEELGIASFNLAWGGTAADFKRHVEVCSATDVQWCDTRPKNGPGGAAPTPEEQARASQCQAGVERAAGGAAQSLLVAPCNAYKLNARKIAAGGLALYDDKLTGLTKTIDKVVTEHGVDVIAFQEVRSDDAIRAILGSHAAAFDSCVASHTGFQTVGFAWRKAKTSTPGQCAAETGLAIKENPADPASLRHLRPGVALTLTVGSTPVTFMNIHLKSSCANLFNGSGFPGRELTDADPACQVLNRQVVPLENWIEAVSQVTPMFVLLGDFNRRVDEEARLRVSRRQVRKDGTLPDSANTVGTDGQVSSRFLWQEISDGKPRLVQIPPASAATGCTGFVGLDHIVISRALRVVQSLPLASLKVPVEKKPRQTIGTSDHCPRVTKLDI